MSFRKYGGIHKYATNSIVHSKINTSSILIPQTLGQAIYVRNISGIRSFDSTATFTTFKGNLLLNEDGGGMSIRANGNDIYQNLVISHDALLPLYESVTDIDNNTTYTGIYNIIIGNNIHGIITGNGNTCLGYSAGNNITSGSYNTCLGSSTFIPTSVNYSTAIGSGATTTMSNQIMLGRASETVYCPGETDNLSLNITKNALINGCWFGVGKNADNKNIYIGQPKDIIDTNGSYNNTIIGQGYDNNYFFSKTTNSSGNTVIGANQIISSEAQLSGNTIVGSNCNVPSSASNSTCLGKGCIIYGLGFKSTAIGYGAKTTMNNQIMLGTATETVYCPGTTNNNNNCLVLSSNLVLPTIYSHKTSDNLGCVNIAERFSNENISITVNNPVTIFKYNNVKPGVYIVNYLLYFILDSNDNELYTNIISVSSDNKTHNQDNRYTVYFNYNSDPTRINTINYSTTLILEGEHPADFYLIVSSDISGQIAKSGMVDRATMVRIA